MVKQYLTSLLAFTLIDGMWLALIAPSFYKSHIGHLMSPQPDLLAAGLFYLLFLIGLNIFVINAHRGKSLTMVTLYGGLFGLITYATFDLTSVAVFTDFPYLVAAVDMAWGSILCASISFITARFNHTYRAS